MSANDMSVMPGGGGAAILVLGMHRSGTSATTRVLNLLGAELGANLLEAQADNAKGFWEHAEVVQIHEQLLADLGRSWHDVREMPEQWMEQPASYAAIDKLVRLVRRDFDGRALWAVKDPRMCRLVPLWQEVLKRVGVRAKALIVVRPPDEVAGSLGAREGWTAPHSDLMWMQYTLEAIRYTQDIPRSIMSYDELMYDWRDVARRVGEQLGLSWPNQDEECLREIDEFVSPEDRHHRVVDATVVGAQPAEAMRSLPQQLYACCVEVAAGREDWDRLAKMDQRYLEVANLFREVVQQKYELNGLASERILRIHELERELYSATSLATERGNHLQLLATQHHELIQASAQQQQRIEHLDRLTAERDAELAALRLVAGELASNYEVQSQSNEALSKLCQELDSALRQEQAIEAVASADLEKLRARCDTLSRTLELTFSRRWLARRFWEITRRGAAAGGPEA